MPSTTLHLSAELRRRLLRAARAGRPHEVCGLLLGTASAEGAAGLELVPCRNVEPEPRRGFALDPVEHWRAETRAQARGLRVVGLWHSHPEGPPVPSARDARDARGASDTWFHLIVGLEPGHDEAVRAWRLVGEHFVEAPLSYEEPVPSARRGRSGAS